MGRLLGSKNSVIPTHCRKGHEQTPENKKKTGRGCRVCANINAVLWRKRHPEKCLANVHESSIKGLYKMSPEQYKDILDSQGGHCALCPAVVSWGKRKLGVDHDHTCCPGRALSGKSTCGKCNRGILCALCNQRIGRLEEILECTIEIKVKPNTWYSAAMEYLKKYKPQD